MARNVKVQNANGRAKTKECEENIRHDRIVTGSLKRHNRRREEGGKHYRQIYHLGFHAAKTRVSKF